MLIKKGKRAWYQRRLSQNSCYAEFHSICGAEFHSICGDLIGTTTKKTFNLIAQRGEKGEVELDSLQLLGHCLSNCYGLMIVILKLIR